MTVTDYSIGSQPADVPEPSAIGHFASHLFFWPFALIALWLDLWSKAYVFDKIPPDKAVPVISNFLEFRRSLNDGAVFGSFTGYVGVFIVASLLALAFVFYLFANSTRRQHGLHIALGLILAGALGNLYDRAFVVADIVDVSGPELRERRIIGKVVSPPDSKYVKVGSWPEGAHPEIFTPEVVSIRRQGVVRDFLKFSIRFPSWLPGLSGYDLWPWIFNVADAALVGGVAVLLLHTWFDRKKKPAHVVVTE